ncbi:MAG: hypothetical protein HOP30_17315 [Cyclobacteriaceae bacterium]|nr:hypothetical protein [Cyclobacteriaceae bacterium]
MTKKDFLVLVIKLFGLYAAVSSLFSVIPRMVSFTILQADMTLVILLIGFTVCG